MARCSKQMDETDNVLTTSLGSSYSEASDISGSCRLLGSERNNLVLHQTAPLLLLGTGIDTPSPIQSWRAVLSELRGPRRLWSVCLFSLFASLTAVLAGYTLAYPSSTLINLRELRSFRKGSSLEDAFGVSVIYAHHKIVLAFH